MTTHMADIASRIGELERELEQEIELEIEEKRRRFCYTIEKDKIAFESEASALHKKLRERDVAFLGNVPIANLLVAPVIFSLIIPLVLLDLWVWIYQAICFPVYKMAKVDRSRYILLDRRHLQYLNWVEHLYCNYCGYANGLVAYIRKVAARTEQYFCPIKHALRRPDHHSHYKEFLDFGDAYAYKQQLAHLRAVLHEVR